MLPASVAVERATSHDIPRVFKIFSSRQIFSIHLFSTTLGKPRRAMGYWSLFFFNIIIFAVDSSMPSCSADVFLSRSVVYGRYAWVQNVSSAFSAEVFFRSLCQIGRFVVFMFMIHHQWLSEDVLSSLLLCVFCLFTPRITLPAQLYLKQIDPCRLPHWSTHITTDLVVYRSATWWLNYGRDRRHTSRPTNSPASQLHHLRIFQLQRPFPPTYHPRLVLIWRLHRRWPARVSRLRPLLKPLIVVRVSLRPRPSQMGP